MKLNESPSVEFKTVRSGVRPARVAVLVPQESEPIEWLRVIEVCSQVWGGMYFVVVPTDGTSISDTFWDLLKIYDPDFLTRLPSVHVADLLAQEFTKVLNPFDQFAGIHRPYHIMPISPDNIPYPLTKFIAHVDQSSDCVSPIVKADPLVELLAYSHIGRMTKQTVNELRDEGLTVGFPEFDLVTNPDKSGRLWELVWETPNSRFFDESGKLPRDVSGSHLAAYHPSNMNVFIAPVVLVIGQSTDDFCLFYSLSHMRSDVYWALPGLLDAISNTEPIQFGDYQVNAVFHLAHRIHERLGDTGTGHPFLVTSVSRNSLQLEADVEVLERARLAKGFGKSLPELAEYQFDVNVLLKFRHSAWELNNHLLTTFHAIQLVDGQSTGILDVRPKHFLLPIVGPTTGNPSWISELAVENYQLPSRRVFNNKVLMFGPNAPTARVTSNGVAYVGTAPMILAGTDADAIVAKPKLTTMAAFDIFSLMFEEQGFEISISEKGSYQEGTLQRFGGLEGFSADFCSTRGQLLLKYLDDSPNRPGVSLEGARIRDRSRRQGGV